MMSLAAALVLAQVIRFKRENPPVSGDVAASAEVESVLRRGCYDCHSNQTRRPWYSSVAPASWLLHHDVVDGRHHVNFSTWDKYSGDPGTLVKKLKEIRKHVAAGKMPPLYYALIHPPAWLSAADRGVVDRWAEVAIAKTQSRADPPYR